MDMSKDEPSVYVPMQEQIDTIKYADIQPSPYESSYQQDIYQEQGPTRAVVLTLIFHCCKWNSYEESGVLGQEAKELLDTLEGQCDLVPSICIVFRGSPPL